MSKITKVKLRKKRIQKNRVKIIGSKNIPRLVVFRSNKHISAQLIDDKSKKTLVDISDQKIKNKNELKKTDIAYQLGMEIAKIAQEKKINQCVFDRRWYKYHGKVQKLAEGARKSGLKI